MEKENPKLHELLAVEAQASETANRITKETTKVFSNRQDIFVGVTKENTIFNEEQQHLKAATETKEVQDTVDNQLEFMATAVSNYWDVLAQKEEGNQRAKADISVDGLTIAENVPAIVLLSLEKKLGSLIAVYNAIPTLDAAKAWEQAPEYSLKGVFRTKYPEERKQEKITKTWQVIAEATQHHPAQLKEVETKEEIGKYTITVFSAALTSAEKAERLDRLSKLIIAVKKARQRANGVEIDPSLRIGQALLNYINKGE
jgi:hypothetical protein